MTVFIKSEREKKRTTKLIHQTNFQGTTGVFAQQLGLAAVYKTEGEAKQLSENEIDSLKDALDGLSNRYNQLKVANERLLNENEELKDTLMTGGWLGRGGGEQD